MTVLGLSFKDAIEGVGIAMDAVGVGVIVLGAVAATLAAAWSLRLEQRADRYRRSRRRLGRSILLGLEFFVAGDIIRTVAIEPSRSNVAVLGAIVAIGAGAELHPRARDHR